MAATVHAEIGMLVELTRVLMGVAWRSLEAVAKDVSLSQFRVLADLDRLNPTNGTGLSRRLGLHPSSITRLCDRLVAMGYVTREVNPRNRREVELLLTPAGGDLVDAVLDRRAELLRELTGGLPEKDRDRLAQALPPLLAAAVGGEGEGRALPPVG